VADEKDSDSVITLRDGRYVLHRRLGEGSQGETWEAFDNGILRGERGERSSGAPALSTQWTEYVDRAKKGETRDRRERVAIKAFRVGKAKEWKDVELAEREAKTLARLNHPHLPRYIEHFEEAGALYLVMEKIEGKSCAVLRAEGAILSHADVIRMLEDIGEALRYLHGRSPFIVHRDIKPGNVIRRPDGSFALVDFGAVRDRLKVGGGSTVVGTFGYMAPEQFQGRASPKSDLYGLGATALAMLTGTEPEELPHEGLGIDVRRALPASTPLPLVKALTAMLIPDPDRRVDSIDDALAFLKRSVPPPSPRAAPAPAVVAVSPAKELTKKERRRLRQERRAADRAEKRRRSAEASTRAIPFLPRLVAKVGLLAAQIVVWAVVGVAVPLVLTLLSLVFGKSMRAAAKACGRASSRATKRIGDASSYLSGYRASDPAKTASTASAASAEEAARVRVVAVTPEQAQSLAIQDAERERRRIATQSAEEREADVEADRFRDEVEAERQRLVSQRPPRRR